MADLPRRASRDDWDEDDVRVRPGRGSRRRTKQRPAHAEAIGGTVLGVDRGRFTVLLDDDPDGAPRFAIKARELGRKGVLVGDRVRMTGDTSDSPDAMARIVVVEPRQSMLRRSADDNDPAERPIVANADQLGIVTALADPEPSPGFIDRCLAAAYDAGVTPLLIMTKSDLGDPRELLDLYRGVDLDWVCTRSDDHDSLDGLREHLAGHRTVLVGHSGVGKSTLVNALVPEASRRTGAVNVVTGHGRHTSTSAVALALPGPGGSAANLATAAEPGLIIDTPGVRSFGLAHVTPDRLLAAFDDLAPGTAGCPRGCSHDEPDCGLDEYAAAQGIPPERLASLRRILAGLRARP